MNKKTGQRMSPFVTRVNNASALVNLLDYLIAKYKEDVYLNMMEYNKWKDKYKTDWGNNGSRKKVADQAYGYWNERMQADRLSLQWPQPVYPNMSSLKDQQEAKKQEQKVKEELESLGVDTSGLSLLNFDSSKTPLVPTPYQARTDGSIQEKKQLAEAVAETKQKEQEKKEQEKNTRTIFIAGAVIILALAVYLLFFKKKQS